MNQSGKLIPKLRQRDKERHILLLQRWYILGEQVRKINHLIVDQKIFRILVAPILFLPTMYRIQ